VKSRVSVSTIVFDVSPSPSTGAQAILKSAREPLGTLIDVTCPPGVSTPWARGGGSRGLLRDGRDRRDEREAPRRQRRAPCASPILSSATVSQANLNTLVPVGRGDSGGGSGRAVWSSSSFWSMDRAESSKRSCRSPSRRFAGRNQIRMCGSIAIVILVQSLFTSPCEITVGICHRSWKKLLSCAP